MDKLKEQITMELKKAFPVTFKTKKDNAATPETKTAENTPAANPSTPANEGAIYDRISSVITEEINPHHFLLRGRKEIVFNEIKRTIEIQALVDRKAINAEDILNSSNILESHIVVVK
jgi:hypothetical protein